MQKVLIFDTSILCVWLEIPGKETCGSDADRWDKARVEQFIQQEKQAGTTFVLPLASIIETGNHIAQASSKRYETAQALAQLMKLAADQQSPWAAFTEQSVLWEAEGLRILADEWSQLAVQGISIGDATIKTVAEYYSKLGFRVEILTGDKGLKSYEPTTTKLSRQQRPRRRKKSGNGG